MRNNLTRRLCTGGVIAALYAVLTLALPMLSYGSCPRSAFPRP